MILYLVGLFVFFGVVRVAPSSHFCVFFFALLFFVFFLNVDESDERVSTFSRRGVAVSLSLAV